MPFALLSNDIVEVTVLTKFDEQVGINRWFLNYSSTSGTAVDEDVANALEPPINLLYNALLSASANFGGIGVRIWRAFIVQTNPFYVVSAVAPGAVAGDPLPGQVSGLIKKVSNLPGKKAYGRAYIPFPSEADNSNLGRPSAGYVTRLQALAGYMEAPGAFVGPNGLFALTGRHKWRTNPDSPPPANYAFAPVTQFVAREAWATMRSRGDYGAANILPWQ